jgi:ribonuclease D
VPDAPPLLSTAAELKALARRVKASGRVALDTEFVWERTYRPILGVIQVATDAEAVVIDGQATSRLDPLFALLLDPQVPVVLHGGGQDLEILAQLLGEPIRGVVDTQVEAAFLGYGLQVGLGTLLERVLRVRIRKDQTYTDWTKRPLKPEQMIYARDDVIHLLPMHDAMRAALVERGRDAWVEEELRRLERPERYRPLPEAERYRAVKGWQRLRPRELAVLRPLAAWRERTAQRADVRPGFIANDMVLIQLAQRPVTEAKELKGVRGLSAGTVDRHGRALVAAVREGLECDEASWPTPPPRTRRQPIPSGLTALLRAAVQAVAEREEIAPEIIASTAEFEALIGQALGASDAAETRPLRVLEGWRATLVGEQLAKLARGELSIRYDARAREIVADPVRRVSRG